MIKSRKDLENKILEYNPAMREKIARDPEARNTLEAITEREFNRYRPYLSGAANTAGKIGRGLGYAGDLIFWGSAIAAATNPIFAPYMLTGLLAKKLGVAAQAPEALKTLKYMNDTHEVAGGMRNLGAKALIYIPGATIVDRGLGKISERKLLKKTAYEAKEAFEELDAKPWHTYTAEALQRSGRYSNVKDRKDNVIRVYGDDRGPVLAEQTPEGNIKVDFRNKGKSGSFSRRKVA